MNLTNKKLLLLGGSAFAKDIKSYALEKNIYLIAVGKYENLLYKQIANESYNVDFENRTELSNLIREKNIDGFFTGASEDSILTAIDLSELTNVRFYTNREQWEQLSNKETFKKLLRSFNIGVIPEYNIDDFLNKKKYTDKLYPVLIKPIDGSGAKGISICNNYEQLVDGYKRAIENSREEKVLLEKYMVEMDDVFIRYHIQDGIYSISSSFDKYTTSNNSSNLKFPIAYLHPTKHLQKYIENIDYSMQNMFKSIRIKNGVMTLQAFVDKDSNFYFYEAGFRLGGSQSYIFTDIINKSNSLHYMINLALTGKMSEEKIISKDKPFFKQSCCNLYFPVYPCIIKEIIGIEEISRIPEILNITEFCKVGDHIKDTNSLDQVCFRMHLMAEDSKKLSDIIYKVNSKLKILAERGENMIMEYFTDFDNLKCDFSNEQNS